MFDYMLNGIRSLRFRFSCTSVPEHYDNVKFFTETIFTCLFMIVFCLICLFIYPFYIVLLRIESFYVDNIGGNH